MKKGFKSLVVLGLLSVLASCGSNSNSGATSTTGSKDDSSSTSKIKVGLITLHDENSTYDKNFIDAFKAAATKMNVEAVVKTGVPESTDAYDKATDLADAGCKFVFADSFGHESHILKAAKEFPDVQFSHATGTTAHTSNVSNFHNAFASIYEGRYLAGVAAGLKLQAMNTTNHKIGYVGAFQYAEVVSGYTSFYLGVKSVVEDVTMDVKFTGSWYDETKESETAQSLINGGCVLISQHADSYGAPNMCEEKKVPNVTYNGSTESKCPETYLISSKVNWEPYFEYCFGQVKENKAIDTDWTGTLGTTLYNGSVAMSEPGKKAAVSGTEDKLNEVAAKLRNGTLKVFDTSKFTVSSDYAAAHSTTLKIDEDNHVTSYLADVNTDAAFTGDTEVITTKDGITYFAESEKRSAPYFDLQIEGITIKE